MMTNTMTKETGTKYSRAELKAAFELVEDKTNWKNPINKVVGADANLDMIREAVIFFAGCVPTYTLEGTSYRVKAVGYYVAVGA